jgi:phosphatidylethanolamine N-methyltransferase
LLLINTDAALSIAFNPVFWNIAARSEYEYKVISRWTGKKLGCYFLALSIFSLGVYRDLLYKKCLQEQPISGWENSTITSLLGAILFIAGNVLVVSSMWALGITGTYLGDYFGIYMEKRVTSFPFNITDNPMYNGSVMSFIGTALWYGKPAGLLLSLQVFCMYKIACWYEE